MSTHQEIEQLTSNIVFKTTIHSRFNKAFQDHDYQELMAKARIPIYAWVQQ